MRITGTDIDVNLKVLPLYKPITKLAVAWHRVSNNNWRGVDRGAISDIYEATVSTYLDEGDLSYIIDGIQANRDAYDNVLVLSDFADTEHVFGADLDYDNDITCTVIDYGTRNQKTWRGWALELRLRVLSPTFSGSPSMPTLRHCDIGFVADSDYTINKLSTYNNNFAYQDHEADHGTFEGIFTLTDADMVSLRRYIATQRTGDFTLSDSFGVAYPFGTRSSGSYPYTCKLIEWDDLGMFGLHWWKIRLRFAEVL